MTLREQMEQQWQTPGVVCGTHFVRWINHTPNSKRVWHSTESGLYWAKAKQGFKRRNVGQSRLKQFVLWMQKEYRKSQA